MSEGSSAGQLWKETKTAKVACSGSLAPRLINNGYVTAKITYNTVHAHHEVPAWSQDILCCTNIYGIHLKSGSVAFESRVCPLGQP